MTLAKTRSISTRQTLSVTGLSPGAGRDLVERCAELSAVLRTRTRTLASRIRAYLRTYPAPIFTFVEKFLFELSMKSSQETFERSKQRLDTRPLHNVQLVRVLPRSTCLLLGTSV